MNASTAIRLLLVDDHPIVRAGLRTITDLDPRLQVVAEASSAAEAVEKARAHGPDLILLDVRLGDSTGMAACREIKAALPDVKVLFLTSFADDHLVLEAMEAGADGYLLKENDARRIVEAMGIILRGGTVFDPVVTRSLLRPKPAAEPNPLLKLTQRELHVLAEVATGKTDKEVAEKLNLSVKTARNYLDNVFQKLGVNTRTQAAMLHARWANASG